jgi:hypothetical protein
MGLATLAGLMSLATLGAFKIDFTLFYQQLFNKVVRPTYVIIFFQNERQILKP